MTSVRYIAPPRGGWAHPAGSFARGSRDYCHALDAADYGVWIDSECPQDSAIYRSSQNLSDEVRAAEKFAKPILKPDVLIVSAFMIDTEQYDARKLAKLDGEKYRARILQTTFETTRPSQKVLDTMRQWDAVFVPSEWNASCLREAGIERVYAIPHVVTEHYKPLFALKPPRHPALKFGWVGTWEPRKAGEVAVRAFLKAFEPGEAQLVIKCNTLTQDWAPYMPPNDMIDALVRHTRARGSFDWSQDIIVLPKIMSREQLFKFYEDIDVFVTTSHGEGFCLPGLEAKLAGRRVVATDSGGVREFMTENDILVGGKLGACPWARMYGWPEESLWYHHDVEEVASALRACTMLPPPREFDWSDFSAPAVGLKMGEMIRNTINRCNR